LYIQGVSLPLKCGLYIQGVSLPLNATCNSNELGYPNSFYVGGIMRKLKFYEISGTYIDYLKQFESKLPIINYDNHDKFVCGVVLNIKNINYYAPVSSFNKQQKTNFLILNEQSRAISSIRFSFMFPAPINVLKVKDFNKEPYTYKRLLLAELAYCNKNIEKILSKAKQVHKIGMTINHPLAINCCNFKILEEKYIEWQNQNGDL